MGTIPALLTIKYTPYFIQNAIVKAVQPIYSNEVFGILWDIDLSLLLEIRKQNGETFEYQLNIRGNFKKDNAGRIIGWGSAFKIQKLFNNLSLVGIINSDGSIQEESLQPIIGKEVFVLNYISGTKEDGRLKYQMWDTINADKISLISDFLKSADKGYPKNYNPNALLEETRKSMNVGNYNGLFNFIHKADTLENEII